jgi:hypothetical protein
MRARLPALTHAHRGGWRQENSLDEIQALISLNLLSADEASSLIAHRRDYEYKLCRFEVIREDYLRYMEYELQLHRLLAVRQARQKVAGKKSGSMVEAAFRSHVNIIFDRALRKFPGDFAMWAAAVDFAQTQRSDKRVSELLGAALKLHPCHEAFWITAAAHEFEQGGNASAGRALFMQALRVNPASHALHHEYFKFELLYLHKVLSRRAVLGIEPAAPDQGQGQDQALGRGDLLKVVYRNGCSSVPASVAFRTAFVGVCQAFAQGPAALPAAELVRHVAQDVEAVFGPSSEEAWDFLARLEREHAAGDAVFVRGLQQLSTPLMWENRVKFAVDLGQGAAAVAQLAEAGAACAMLSEKACVLWLQAVRAGGAQDKEDRRAPPSKRARASPQTDLWTRAVQAGVELFPQSAAIWAERCSRDASLLELALQRVPVERSLDLCRMFLRGRAMEDARALIEKMTVSPKAPLDELLEFVLSPLPDPAKEIEALEARGTPARVSARVFSALLAAEPVARGEHEQRALFAAAVARHDDADLWARYIRFERALDPVSDRAKALLLRGVKQVPGLMQALESGQPPQR